MGHLANHYEATVYCPSVPTILHLAFCPLPKKYKALRNEDLSGNFKSVHNREGNHYMVHKVQ